MKKKEKKLKTFLGMYLELINENFWDLDIAKLWMWESDFDKACWEMVINS